MSGPVDFWDFTLHLSEMKKGSSGNQLRDSTVINNTTRKLD